MDLIIWVWIFLLMVFCHIIDDFHIQGFLAQAKQRTWWINQPEYTGRYKHDYITALAFHGFEWAIIVHIPIFFYIGISDYIIFSVILSAMIHAIIDDLKCNQRKINLCQDQILHILQLLFIIITVAILYT